MLDACVIGVTSHEVDQALRSQHHCGYDRFIIMCSEIKVTNRNVNKKRVVEKGW